MANIVEIRDAVASAIAGITPDYEVPVKFREAHYRALLEEQAPLHSAQETSRQFQVTINRDPLLSEAWRTGSGDPYWGQTLQIRVRYRLFPGDYGILKLTNMAGADVPLIYKTTYLAELGVDVVQRNIDLPTDEPELVLVNPEHHIFMMILEPRVFYTQRS